MKLKIAKFIRVLTVVPIIASVLMLINYFAYPTYMSGKLSNFANLAIAIACLSLLPLLAYPIHFAVPALRKRGRPLQRNMAIGFAVVGYIIGMLTAVCTGVCNALSVLYCTYLISGILVAVVNKLFSYHASCHAAGVCGPVAYALYAFGWYGLFGLAIIIAVFWASIIMKRHTLSQLIAGSLLSLIALTVSVLIFPF